MDDQLPEDLVHLATVPNPQIGHVATGYCGYSRVVTKKYEHFPQNICDKCQKLYYIQLANERAKHLGLEGQIPLLLEET